MTTTMNIPSLTIDKAACKQILVILLCCIVLTGFVMLCTSGIAFCTGGEATPGDATDAAADAISNAVNQMATKIYQTMRSIITPIVIVAFGFAGFQFLMGGAQGTEKARKTMIGSCIGLAIVIFAPLFGQAIATWFAASGGGDLSQYNPLA